MQKISKAGATTLLGVACLTIMVGCVLVPGLPSIGPALGVAGAESWLVTVPSLGVVLLGPLAAWVIARIGLRNALRLGLFGYGLLGAAGAMLHGPVAVFADRVLLGGATALIMASGTGLISTFYDGRERLVMIARQGMAIELGGVVFLAVAGSLAGIGWRWPFALYLIAWVLGAMVELFVPRPAAPLPPPEGAAVGSPPAQKLVYAAALLSQVCFFIAVIVLPMDFATHGISEAATGRFLAGVSVVAVCAASQMPRVSSKLGGPGTLVVAFVCYALGHVLFSLAGGTWALCLPAGLLLGIGFGLSIPLVNHLTVELSPEHVRGRNLAFLSMAIFSGQFLASFLGMVPGGAARVFAAAALLALLVSAGLWWIGRAMSRAATAA